jgi:uncharacterized membrane protein
MTVQSTATPNALFLKLSDLQQAKAMRSALRSQQLDGHLDVIDIVIISQSRTGFTRYRQLNYPLLMGALGGSCWGFVAGLLLAAPGYGLLIGSLIGLYAGWTVDFGFDDHWLHHYAHQQLAPGQVIIAILYPHNQSDIVFKTLTPWANHYSLCDKSIEEQG